MGSAGSSGWAGGVFWDPCRRPALHPPVSCRNTRSTPSTRCCSLCCGGVRSSIACSARFSTASNEPSPVRRLAHAASCVSCSRNVAVPSASPWPSPCISHTLLCPCTEGSTPTLEEGVSCPVSLPLTSASDAGPGNVLLEFGIIKL